MKTDLQKLFYPMEDLSKEQKEILESDGYKSVRSRTPGQGQASYMIKKMGASNQSDEHFTLTRLVAGVAEKENLDVRILDYGKNADVIITNSEGKTAGFEIEMNTNNNSDLLNKVDRLNETKGLDVWYFVTAADDVKKY